MRINSLPQRPQTHSPKQAPALPWKWKPGDRLRGRIVEALGPARFTLDLDGQRLAAKAPPDLAVGQEIDLQVNRLSPRPHLRIEPTHLSQHSRLLSIVAARLSQWREGSVIPDRLVTLLADILPRTSRQRQIADQLKNWLKGLRPSGDGITSRWIFRFLRRGGLTYEADLAGRIDRAEDFRETARKDLKALLLRAIESFPDSSAPARSAREALLQIEARQIGAFLSRLQGQLMDLDIPLPGGETARLCIQEDGPSSDRDQDSPCFRIRLELSLRVLGPVHVDAWTARNQIRVALEGEKDETIQLLKQALPRLERSLARCGFGRIKTRVGPPRHTASRIPAGEQRGGALVDLIA